MNQPQTIQVFLPDGSPTSIKEAEITNRLVKAILFPRNKIQKAATREISTYTGVYFLFGFSENGAKPVVYIGEGENCLTRIQNHNREEDFWTHCVIVTTKTNELTKTDVKFLEHYCLKNAKEIGRYSIKNSNGSNKPSLSESREYDLLDNFETLKILLATLGFPVFEKVNKQQISSKDLLSIAGRGIFAQGDLIDDGFVVFKGSQAKKETVPSCHEYLINLRNRLIKDEVILERKDHFEFIQDYVFNSPSTAGGVVLGRSTNGWKGWKDKGGKTLDELKRK